MIALLLILILCVLLFGAGAVLAGFGWLAVIVVALALLYFLIIAAAGIFVSARDLAQEAPGAVAALPGAVAAFFRGYAKILGAPILGPLGYWRSVCERRARGERVGAISIGLTFLWTFSVGAFLSWLAFFTPILMITIAYQAWL